MKPARDVVGRLLPTGYCWCGCNEICQPGKFFMAGHNKRAVANTIERNWGSDEEFIAAMNAIPEPPR